VGDTGFEPVTSSVSGQKPCLGMRISVAAAACRPSPMFATVRARWPTVWPTMKGCCSERSAARYSSGLHELSRCYAYEESRHLIARAARR
jgi:hypothetical protein